MVTWIASKLHMDIGGVTPFDNVSFKAARRNRIALSDPNGVGKTMSRPEAIAEFFPIAPERVVEIHGPELERVRLATEADADAVAAKIDQLFAEIRRTTED